MADVVDAISEEFTFLQIMRHAGVVQQRQNLVNMLVRRLQNSYDII